MALGPKAKSPQASSLFADEDFSKIGNFFFSGFKICFERLINDQYLSGNDCHC